MRTAYGRWDENVYLYIRRQGERKLKWEDGKEIGGEEKDEEEWGECERRESRWQERSGRNGLSQYIAIM